MSCWVYRLPVGNIGSVKAHGEQGEANDQSAHSWLQEEWPTLGQC